MVLIAIFSVGGCGLFGDKTGHKYLLTSAGENAAGSGSEMAISREMLKKAGLHETWVCKVPLGRASEIAHLFYHGGRLYSLNSHNTLTAIDASTGTILWSQVMTAAKSPASTPYFYEGNIVFVISDRVVQIRESDGKIMQSLPLQMPVSTSIARLGEQLFVGSTDRRFYGLRMLDGIPLWHNVCEYEPIGTVVAFNDKVYFVTQENRLYVSAVDQRDILWKVDSAGALCGVVIDNNQCFLPSGDTTLRCLNPETGVAQWQYLAGGSLLELPALTAQACYQPVNYKSLVCLNRQNGAARWELKNGRQLLAENGSVTYAMTLNREFAVMDNVLNKKVLSFYAPNVDLFAVNNEDARCFFARKNGMVWCQEPDVVQNKPRSATPAAEESKSEQSSTPAPAESKPDQQKP